jgi:LysR family transcriptional regulator, carnitine catabolism transcriptional activator
MNLRELRAVVAVVDHGSFTRAAAALHVAQPSLSQAVAKLERELGVELFHRTPRRVVVTAAGEALLEPARQALRAVDTARAAAAGVAGLTAGRVDLVSLPTLAVDPVVRFVGEFRREYPEVSVRIAEPDDPADLLALVRDGTCELGFTELPIAPASSDADLGAHELEAQEYVAVLPPGVDAPSRVSAAPGRGAITIDALAELPIVTTPQGTSTRRQLDDAFATAGHEPNLAVETSHREMIVPLVLAGAGAALVPEPLAVDAVARGATAAAVTPRITRRVGIVQRRASLSPAAEAFVRSCLSS